MALLLCMLELSKKRDLEFKIIAAHLNHGIRAPGPENREGTVLQNPDLIDNGLVSAQRVHVDKVESAPGKDGGVVLVSQKSNIKLDKAIVYIFEAGSPDSH